MAIIQKLKNLNNWKLKHFKKQNDNNTKIIYILADKSLVFKRKMEGF